MNILPINKCESITTASTRTGNQQLRFALQLFPGRLCWALGILALIHLSLAFIILSFLVVHVYMTTTGHSVTSHVTAMCCGWEEVEEGTQVEDWERGVVS